MEESKPKTELEIRISEGSEGSSENGSEEGSSAEKCTAIATNDDETFDDYYD